jgi:hypothetical protein
MAAENSKDSSSSRELLTEQPTHNEPAVDPSSTGASDTSPWFLRPFVNLVLIVLCALAIVVFGALHGGLWSGITSAGIGFLTVAIWPLVLWLYKEREEDLKKEVRNYFESLKLRRWLLFLFAALVLFNFLFLPPDVWAGIAEKWSGKRVMLRIVPAGDLYTALATLQDRDDTGFDLSVQRIDGIGRGNQIYRLPKVGPGLVYTGAAKEDLKREHDSRPNESEQLVTIAFQDPSIISKDVLSEIKANWQEVRYLPSANFRENQRIEIEVWCVGKSRSEVLAKRNVTLEDYPLQTVYFDAELKDNPCAPPD